MFLYKKPPSQLNIKWPCHKYIHSTQIKLKTTAGANYWETVAMNGAYYLARTSFSHHVNNCRAIIPVNKRGGGFSTKGGEKISLWKAFWHNVKLKKITKISV
jgi:hypothetical protein